MRLLLVVGRFPWPPRRGDQIRAQQMAELLAAAGHRVTLLVPEPEAGSDAGPEAGAVLADLPFRVETYTLSRFASQVRSLRAALRGLPAQQGLFHQPDLGRKLRRLAPEHDLVILQLVRLAGHADDLGDTPFAVDLIDSLSLNFTCRARFDAPWRRALLDGEAEALLRAEAALLGRAAAGLVVCDRDRAWLAESLPELAGRLHVVPLQRAALESTGPSEPGPGPHPGEGPGRLVAFTGNLGYFPNADAAGWWVSEVWPALHRDRPELRLVVAGSRPGLTVRRLLLGARGAVLEADPDSLAAVLAQASAAVAPLRAGSGVPVKVLEAWESGVPVVASRRAAEGAGATPGKELLVAETVREWREAVVCVLDDPDLARRLVAAGRQRLAAHHSAEVVAAALTAALESAVASAVDRDRPGSPVPAPG